MFILTNRLVGECVMVAEKRKLAASHSPRSVGEKGTT